MSTWTQPLARRLGRRGADRELGSTLLGIAVGAGLMFLFDPRAGRRRRALVRDKAASLVDDVGAAAEMGAKDAANRMQGVVARLAGAQGAPADDTKLENRIRARLGRASRHARALQVQVRGRNVELSGPCLTAEVATIVDAVARTPGVEEVTNHLDVHETSDGVPALQGSGPRRSAAHVLKPAALLGLGAASASYAGLALVRRRPLALVAGIVGTLAAAKAMRPEGRRHDAALSERRGRVGAAAMGGADATTEPLPTGAGASERAPLAFGGEGPPSSGVSPTAST